MAQCLHAIYDEIERRKSSRWMKNFFLATLYTNKLYQLEKEIKDIERQVVDWFFLFGVFFFVGDGTLWFSNWSKQFKGVLILFSLLVFLQVFWKVETWARCRTKKVLFWKIAHLTECYKLFSDSKQCSFFF